MAVYYQDTHKRRTIDGKLFKAHSFTSSKTDAKGIADSLRHDRGRGRPRYSARIIKTGKVWSVYYR